MADSTNLTRQERQAIVTLKRLAASWPKSLWLFSASGTLWVMKTDTKGERVVLPNKSFDQDFTVTSIEIPNDGGDW